MGLMMRGTHFAELSAFVAVAEQASFTKAARRLGRSTVLPVTEGLFLFYPSRRQNSAALRAFIDFLRSDFKIQRSPRALVHDPGKPVRDLIRSVPT